MQFKLDMLEEHMKVVMQIVDKLMEALKYYMESENGKMNEACNEILRLERKADILRNSIQKRWAMVESPRRYSAMRLVETIDLIADYAEDVALLLQMREGSIPKQIHGDFNEFLEKVHGTVDMLSQSISLSSKLSKKFCKDCENFERMYSGSDVGTCKKLDRAPTAGFRPEDTVCEIEKAEVLYVMTDDVGVKEEEADIFERKFRKMIFDEELKLKPLQAIHLLQIVNNTDYIANSAKDASNALKQLL